MLPKAFMNHILHVVLFDLKHIKYFWGRKSLIFSFFMSSDSTAVAYGERGSPLGAVWRLSLLHCVGQQGPERATDRGLQNYCLHHTGKRR